MTIRNRIRLLMDVSYCSKDFATCYVDEYLYYHGKRWRRNPTLGTFVLGLSSQAGIRLVPVPRGRAEYARTLIAMGLDARRLTTCNVELAEILSHQCESNVMLSEWTMAARDGYLVKARGKLSAFWPYFKRNMRIGRMTSRGEHLTRYLSEYAFRFQEGGQSHRIFAKLLGVVEKLG